MYGGFNTAEEFLKAWEGFNVYVKLDWAMFNVLVIGNRKTLDDFIPSSYIQTQGKIASISDGRFVDKLIHNEDCIFYKRNAQVSVQTMTWQDIVFIAYVLGVQPELVVDEKYMYEERAHIRNSYGMRVYKIFFEAWRQGKTPEDLIHPRYLEGFPEKERRSRFRKTFCVGRPDIKLSYKMDMMLYVACNVLGMIPYDVFMPPHPGEAFTKFMAVSRYVANTDLADAEFLYGVTRVLATKAISDNDELLKDALCKLVDRRGTWGVIYAKI